MTQINPKTHQMKEASHQSVIPSVWSSVVGEVTMSTRTWHSVVSTQAFRPLCFKLDWLSFHCWVTRVLYIFWVQVFCQMYTYWKYFLSPVANLFIYQWCLLMNKSLHFWWSVIYQFLIDNFLRTVLGSQQSWAESMTGKYRQYWPTQASPPTISISHQMVHLLRCTC